MANIISDETIEYVGILAKLELSEERTITAVISREEDSYFLETAGRKIKGGEKITLQDGAYTVFDFSEDGILEMSSYYTLDEYVSPKGEAGGAEKKLSRWRCPLPESPCPLPGKPRKIPTFFS